MPGVNPHRMYFNSGDTNDTNLEELVDRSRWSSCRYPAFAPTPCERRRAKTARTGIRGTIS